MPNAKPTRDACILVVEDSPTFRRAAATLLEGQGYRVEMAESGEDAFELCLVQDFDAVVSDIWMGPLSGVQLCRLLKQDPAMCDVPVVLLTAADDPRSRYWARQAGAAAFVTKERAREELLPELERVLGEVSPRRRERQRGERRGESRERLSHLLEGLLFSSIVATDVRRLVDFTGDRTTFARQLAEIAAAVAEYSYLVLRLFEGDGAWVAVHARESLPRGLDRATREALGLQPPPAPVTLLGDLDPAGPPRELALRDQVTLTFAAGGDALGSLTAFSSRRLLDAEDRRGLGLVAEQLGLPVRILQLDERLRAAGAST